MSELNIILIIINSCLVVWICKSNKVHQLLKILWCISYFGWNALPAILMYVPSLFGKDVIASYDMDVTASDVYISCSCYNQIFLFFVYFIAFKWIQHKRPPKILRIKDFQSDSKIFNILFYTSFVLLLYRIFKLINSNTSYLESNDLSNMAAIGPIDFISSLGVAFLLGSVFLYKKRLTPLAFKLSISTLAIFFLVHTLRGGRVYIFGIVIIILYYALEQRRTIYLVFVSILSLIALAVLPSLAILRGSEKIKVDDISVIGGSSASSLVLAEILTKTNSVMYGSYLIGKDGIGNYDGKMYTSTIYALVPRFIDPTKPEPGSVDGTQYGLPARASAIYSVSGKYNDIGNNGVPASLSSLWGGGWLAVIVEIIFIAYLFFFINSVFYSNKPVFACFIFSILSFPVGVLEIPLPTILIEVQRDIILYFIILLIMYPFRSKSRRHF